jgi:DNA-binding LacI/PurR family transcriptional regulator/signal transduction histidine kinase/ActR/RegA family two-component response regulator
MNRHKVIALMMGGAGQCRGDYQGQLRAGVEQFCREANIDLWVYAGRSDWRTRDSARGLVYDLVAPDRIDGIILAGGTIATFVGLQEVCARVRERCPVPICSAGYRLDGTPSIVVDNGAGMGRVVEHLTRHHRRRHFAFIAGPQGHEESEARLSAAREVLVREGIGLPADAVVYGNFSPESGMLAMRELLQRLKTIDVVIAANDDMGAGALDALSEQGRRCPEDVALVGFDDVLSAWMSTPSMTTVRQPVFEMGMQAAEWLAAAWRGETLPALMTLPTEPVLRESCGCDPLEGLGPRSRRSGARAEPGETKDELAALLRGTLGDARQSAAWADRLSQALDSERSGQSGLFRKVLQKLLDELHPDAQLFDVQRAISHLRGLHTDLEGADLSGLFHQALMQIGYTMDRREMHRRLQQGFLTEELRISRKRLATSLSFDCLRDVLLQEFPRFSVRNAIVSIYPPADFENLIPLACLIEGTPFPLDAVPFPAYKLKPDGVPQASQCTSLVVMPLDFEKEPQGIAMVELPIEETYPVFREEIANAIKTVRLHEMLMQQQERLKLQAQIENQATAERLRSLSLIAGGVAHDLNNALGPLLALPDAIRQELAMNARALPEHLTDLDTMRDAAQHAAHTIRDLLTLGRSIDAPRRTMDINRVLVHGRRGFSQLAERTPGVRIRLLAAESPLFVRVSHEHLVRAVSNLVANAADAMTGPGEIFIRVLERTPTERLMGIEPVEPGRYAVIEVEDSGCGIPDENLPHVFEPFFSSKSQTARGGTGLGLAIVHQVVRQCGGYVQVRSRVGVGTTFGLYLPIAADEVASQSSPPAPPVGGNERVLVVDDERVQLRTAQRVLRQLGYRVSTAESGMAAVALFEQNLADDPFSLVILDIMMPGSLNGLATLERLRISRPGQKALFATGYAPEQLARESGDASTPWLAKPYTAAALAIAVRNALEIPRPAQP